MMGSLFVSVDDPSLRLRSDFIVNSSQSSLVGTYVLPALQCHIRKLCLPRQHVCFDCNVRFNNLFPNEGKDERMRKTGVPMTLKRLTGSTSLLQDGCATGRAAETIKRHEELGGYGNLPRLTIVGWRTTAGTTNTARDHDGQFDIDRIVVDSMVLVIECKISDSMAVRAWGITRG